MDDRLLLLYVSKKKKVNIYFPFIKNYVKIWKGIIFFFIFLEFPYYQDARKTCAHDGRDGLSRAIFRAQRYDDLAFRCEGSFLIVFLYVLSSNNIVLS